MRKQFNVDENIDSNAELNDELELSKEDNYPLETSLEREMPSIFPTSKYQKPEEGEQNETDRLLTINTVLFSIGILAVLVQLATFIAIIVIDIEVIVTFTWIPLMTLSLAGGFIGVGFLLATFIVAMIYKSKCRKNGVQPKRGRWYTMWISSLILALFFFGNLVVTAVIFFY